MKVERLDIPEVLLIEPVVWPDDRGFFFELYRDTRYRDAGIPVEEFCQDSSSFSHHGVLRGLHFQSPGAQGKLISVLSGSVFDVAVDVRDGSPTFGKAVSADLTGENHHQLWIPAGFAHGFVVTGDHAVVVYKVAGPYQPANEYTLLWNDPELDIPWPIQNPSLSKKDAAGRSLKSLQSAGKLSF